jgi:hypothetical protein
MGIKRFFLVGLILLALIATPLLSLAQDDAEILEVDTSDWEEFTSEDENFTLLLPPDWVAGPGRAPRSITIATSDSVVEAIASAALSENRGVPGDKAVVIFGVLPARLFEALGVTLAEDTTAEEIIAEIASGRLFAAAGDDVEFSETVTLELSEDVEAGAIEIRAEDRVFRGYLFVFEASDGVIVIGAAIAYLDEFDEEFQATVLAILQNLEVNITSEDLN